MAIRRLFKNCKGASVIELALAMPVLLIFLLGTFELGVLFFADAGLKSATGEAARYATLYPTPTDAQIKARLASAKFGLSSEKLGTPQVLRGETDGRPYVEITWTYNTAIDPRLLPSIPVTLTARRRAYLQAG